MVQRQPVDNDEFDERDEFDEFDEFDEETEGIRRLIHRSLHFGIWLLGFPFHLFALAAGTLWSFLYAWIASRSIPALLRGLPATVCLCGIGILSLVPPPDLALRYRELAAEATVQGDSKAVELWLEKAVGLSPNDKMFQFNLALTAERDGRYDRARQIMHRLAPNDRKGYPDAHFWVARNLLKDDPTLTPELARVLEFHLTHGLDSEQAAPEAHAMLARLLLSQQDYNRAIPHFIEAAKTKPELRLVLGQLYAMQGNLSRAKRELEKALVRLSDAASRDPENIDAQLGCAQCLALLGREPEAERILKAGLHSSEDVRFSQALTSLYLRQFDQVWQEDHAQRDRALVLLQASSEIAPNDPRLLERLARIADAPGPARAEVCRLLNRTIAEGKATPLVHVLLGVIAAEEGDFETAKLHNELGLELQPQTMDLMNNLAWSIAHADPPDLDRALKLANAALQAAPGHPEVLETRGQILGKLGRWKEAIIDLEKALRVMPERARVHDTLALAYENLGQEQLAEEHRRLAAELNASTKEKQ